MLYIEGVMMHMRNWLEGERGRAAKLAKHLGITSARAYQFGYDGVPLKHMEAVEKFTKRQVKIREMVEQRMARKNA